MGTRVLLADTHTHPHHHHHHHLHHVLAELRGRPADQHQNDQERRDRWPRWKYLGPQCRVSGLCGGAEDFTDTVRQHRRAAMNGVTMGGTKYMFLSATDRV